MNTGITPVEWPPWITLNVIDCFGVRVTVTHGPLTRSWVSRRGQTYTNDTMRIAHQVRAGLIQRQAAINAVTKRLGT